MKTMLILPAMLLALVAGLAGCSSEREEAAENMVDVFDDLVDQMAKIKSNTDLVDAKPKLEKLGARLKDQMAKMKELGEGTAEERAEIEKKYKPRMEKIQARMQDEIQRMVKDLGPSAPFDLFRAMNVDPSDAQMK